jgi:hypothetical protein
VKLTSLLKNVFQWSIGSTLTTTIKRIILLKVNTLINFIYEKRGFTKVWDKRNSKVLSRGELRIIKKIADRKATSFLRFKKSIIFQIYYSMVKKHYVAF